MVSDKLRDLYFENNTMATIKSVNYDLNVSNYAVGSKTCDITLRGYVSAILEKTEYFFNYNH